MRLFSPALVTLGLLVKPCSEYKNKIQIEENSDSHFSIGIPSLENVNSLHHLETHSSVQ